MPCAEARALEPPFRVNRNGGSNFFVSTRFLHANRYPPPDQVRGHASLENALIRLRVEEFEDLARAFGADTGNLAEIGDRGALDLLQGSEVQQQRPFARRADAGDLLQA